MNDFEFIREQLESNPYPGHHHVRLEKADKTEMVMSLELQDYMKNSQEMPHRALYFMLMDNCCGYLARMDRHLYVTLDASVRYMETAAGAGRLICRSCLRRRGRRTTVADTAVCNEEGTELACGTVTMYCLDPDADVSENN